MNLFSAHASPSHDVVKVTMRNLSTPWTMTCLFVIHAGLLLDSMRQNFVTVDEVGHVAAGISHWETGTYSMYRVNPPLARMLEVLPVLLARPDTNGIRPSDAPGVRSEWISGVRFAADNADNYFKLVLLARLAGIAWSLLGGWLVYRWAQDLYGDWGARLALVCWCFDPNVLANAQMVTPDLPATVAGMAATYVFWHYLRDSSWSRAWFAGLLLGIAQLTKFTLLVLYGVWPVLWLIHRIWPPGKSDRPLGLGTQTTHGLVIVFLSLAVINLGYGFAGTGRFLGDFPFVSRILSGDPTNQTFPTAPAHSDNRFRQGWLSKLPVPLPSEYVRGIDVQWREFERKFPSYLAGELRNHGWFYYYIYALGVKVPMGLWALVLWSLVVTLWRHPAAARWHDELTLWLPVVAILGVVSAQTGFNHHVRYVLPILPFLIISTGKLSYFLVQTQWLPRLGVSAFLLWAVLGSLQIHPHYLSYFNELAGGPRNGHSHLVDSNIDWGQDLLHLKKWLARHPEARPLRLAYYNLIDPRIVGIEFSLPPFGANTDCDSAREFGPQPGYFAVSVNYLRGLSTIGAPDGKGKGVYIPRQSYEYFRRFQPIAMAGYSIYIYHIDLAEANRVRRELGMSELDETPEELRDANEGR